MILANQLRRARRLLPSVGWTTFDQALFALSNLVVTLAVARGGGSPALGAFTVAFAAYLVVLGCSRSLVSEPLLTVPDPDRASEAPAVGIVVLFGAGCAVVVGLVGLLLGRGELVVVGVALPVLLLQDTLRYQAFRRGKPAVAALLDGGWLLGSVLAWPLVVASGSPTVAALCWGGGALLGVLVSWPASRPRISAPSSAIAWWRRDARSVAVPLLLDSVIVAVSSQALIFVLAWMAGDSDLGTLRAGQIYFAPLLLVLAALALPLIPRLAQRPSGATTTVAFQLSAAMVALSCFACILIIVAEPFLHALFYADSIQVPPGLLIPIACQVVLSAAAGGLVAVAKARRRAGIIARSRLSSSVIGLALIVVGTAGYGVLGAAWAVAGQMLLYTVELAVRVIRNGSPVGVGADTSSAGRSDA